MQPCGELLVNCLSTEPFSWISAYRYAYRKVHRYPFKVQVKMVDRSKFKEDEKHKTEKRAWTLGNAFPMCTQ